MANGKVLFGGVSTDVPARAVLEKLSKLTPGQFISHDEIKELTNFARNRGDNDADYPRIRKAVARTNTVFNRARRMYFDEHRYKLKPVLGKGYQVYDPNEQVKAESNSINNSFKRMRRTASHLAMIPDDRLDPNVKAYRDHRVSTVAYIQAVVKNKPSLPEFKAAPAETSGRSKAAMV